MKKPPGQEPTLGDGLISNTDKLIDDFNNMLSAENRRVTLSYQALARVATLATHALKNAARIDDSDEAIKGLVAVNTIMRKATQR